MKIITIAGGVTKDAELRRTQNDGTPVLSFSVAVNDYKGNPSYFECSMFGKRGEGLQQYINKGSKVTVCGDLQTREYNGKTYLQVRASEITLQGGKRNEGQQQQSTKELRGGDYGGQSGGFGGGQSPATNQSDLDDEIPF